MTLGTCLNGFVLQLPHYVNGNSNIEYYIDLLYPCEGFQKCVCMCIVNSKYGIHSKY